MAELTHLRDKVNNREIDVQQSQKSLTSKQLENVSPESGSYQDKPFLYQATGTDSNTTETPTAPIAKHLELRGNTVVWNQLVDTNTTEIIPTVGHKYLTMINGVKSIITPADDTPISVSGSTDNVFDLTRMFGTGKEPTSVVQFNRLFPLPYYAYNAGELKSCQSNKLITIGYNQFENLNQFIRVVAGQTYRLMYWNGTALAALTSGSIEEYDGAQTLIQTTTYDNLFDLHTIGNSYPDNGDKGIKLSDETQYVKIVSSSNTNILFNLAWDGSRSDYESYVKHEYTLPNWTNGKSAGNAYDSYYPGGKIIQRIDRVDLGTIDWYAYGTSGHIFRAVVPNHITKQAITMLCAKYECVMPTGNPNNLPDKSFCALQGSNPTSGRNIYIRDDDYTHEEGSEQPNFKTAMLGVILYYELATLITTTGHQTFPENVGVDDFGTMWFTTTETESASNPIIPQGNQFFYPADYALLIDDLNQYTNGDVNVLAKKSDLSGKQDIIQYSIVPTATSSLVGKIIQYIGTTDSTYTNGHFYKCIESSGTYSWAEVIFGGTDPSSLTGTTIPTTSTAASFVGQTYYNSTNNRVYQCVAINNGTYTWRELLVNEIPDIASGLPSLSVVIHGTAGRNEQVVILGQGGYSGQEIAIGKDSFASGYRTVALGAGAKCSGGAIQIGHGTNTTNYTFCVGIWNKGNFRLLEPDGTIPPERITSANWTDTQRLAILQSLGCTVDENGYVKWTATPQGE